MVWPLIKGSWMGLLQVVAKLIASWLKAQALERGLVVSNPGSTIYLLCELPNLSKPPFPHQ